MTGWLRPGLPGRGEAAILVAAVLARYIASSAISRPGNDPSMPKEPKRSHVIVGRNAKDGAFRNVTAGSSVTSVMNKSLYDKATRRADEKIRDSAPAKRAS